MDGRCVCLKWNDAQGISSQNVNYCEAWSLFTRETRKSWHFLKHGEYHPRRGVFSTLPCGAGARSTTMVLTNVSISHQQTARDQEFDVNHSSWLVGQPSSRNGISRSLLYYLIPQLYHSAAVCCDVFQVQGLFLCSGFEEWQAVAQYDRQYR